MNSSIIDHTGRPGTATSSQPAADGPELRFRWQRDKAAVDVGLALLDPTGWAPGRAPRRLLGALALLPLLAVYSAVLTAGGLASLAALNWYLHP